MFRADYRRNVLAVARVIGWAADWRTLRSRPTIARIIERTGLSERTVQRWCRWLEHRGLIECLESGTTPQYRPGILHRGEPNLAREWLLTDPAADVPVKPGGTPPLLIFPVVTDRPRRERAREANPGQRQMDRRSAPDSLPRPSSAPPGASQAASASAAAEAWPSDRNPQRRAEWLAAAESLRRDHLVLRRISSRMLRHLLRPYFQHGWDCSDVRAALEVLPSGEHHHHADRVRVPEAWLAARTSHWLGPDGQPLPSRSQLAAADRARVLADQARRRAERRELPGNVATTGAALARQMLAARLARAERGTVAHVRDIPGRAR